MSQVIASGLLADPLIYRSPDPSARPGWHDALSILAAGIQAADPAAAVRRAMVRQGNLLRIHNPKNPAGAATYDLAAIDNVYLVGAGKAATAMVQAAEEILGDRLTAGVAVTVYGAKGPTSRTTLYEAGHPLPDPSGLMATRHIAKLLSATTPRDLVIALISGGASALLELPAGRLPLIDLQSTTSALLGSGATIVEMNTVRRHLSQVKGGGLARLAAPAPLVSLVLSDVVGSPPDAIASGPTVPDPTTFSDAAAVLSRHDLWGRIPEDVGTHLRAGMAGHFPETAKPGDPVFDTVLTVIVGDNATAADAAASEGRNLGYHTMTLTTHLEGEAREVARVLCAIAKSAHDRAEPLPLPACIVASGETTVTLRRLGGQGGRNQELALAAAIALDGWPAITLAAMGTDGIDGPTDAAGALVDGTTVIRARAAGLDPMDALSRHNSAPFFAKLGDRIVTGPTGTNVNDLAVVLIADLGAHVRARLIV